MNGKPLADNEEIEVVERDHDERAEDGRIFDSIVEWKLDERTAKAVVEFVEGIQGNAELTPELVGFAIRRQFNLTEGRGGR